MPTPPPQISLFKKFSLHSTSNKIFVEHEIEFNQNFGDELLKRTFQVKILTELTYKITSATQLQNHWDDTRTPAQSVFVAYMPYSLYGVKFFYVARDYNLGYIVIQFLSKGSKTKV